MNKKEMDARIAQLELKRIQLRQQFFAALNNKEEDKAGRLAEEDTAIYRELVELLAERNRR